MIYHHLINVVCISLHLWRVPRQILFWKVWPKVGIADSPAGWDKIKNDIYIEGVMHTSLPPLGPILSGSAIWKLIGYQRSKVKEVKEFLSGCHLRLIKTRQTDEIPRHSPFLFKFLIFHSSEASPVAWWLMSKKSARKNWQINLGQFNILRIIVSLINIFDCLQKFKMRGLFAFMYYGIILQPLHDMKNWR